MGLHNVSRMSASISVSDPGDACLADYVGLTDVELRRRKEPADGIFIAEGEKVIHRAVAAGYRLRSLLLSEKWLPSMGEVIARTDAPVYLADDALLEQVTGFAVHRGALASMERRPLPTPAEVLSTARRVAVLEDVNNHTNVGVVFRAAAALGIDAVLLNPRCADPLYRRAVKVSMGAVFAVPYARLADWPGGLDAVREAGLTTLALTPADERRRPARGPSPSVGAVRPSVRRGGPRSHARGSRRRGHRRTHPHVAWSGFAQRGGRRGSCLLRRCHRLTRTPASQLGPNRTDRAPEASPRADAPAEVQNDLVRISYCRSGHTPPSGHRRRRRSRLERTARVVRRRDCAGRRARARTALGAQAPHRARRPHAAQDRWWLPPLALGAEPAGLPRLRHLAGVREQALLRRAVPLAVLLARAWPRAAPTPAPRRSRCSSFAWISPALYILLFPGGFRATCYYYRKTLLPRLLGFARRRAPSPSRTRSTPARPGSR